MTGTQSSTMPAGRVLGGQERRHDLEPLQGTGLALALAGLDGLAQRGGLGVQVERLQPLLDRVRAHRAGEVLAEAVLHLAIKHLVALEVLHLEVLEPGPDRVEAVELTLGAVAQLLDLTLGALAYLALGVGLGTFGLQGRGVLLELLHPVLDVGVPATLELLALDVDLGLERGQVAMPGLVVDGGDHVRGEVDDLLQVLRRDVEQVAKARRNALEVPDVGDRSGELDVAHPLATDLGPGHLDAAALTDDALEPDPLVLAAVALPVPGGTEDLLAEQTVTLRLERAVVDRLRLLHLTVRPRPDLVRRGQSDADLVEEVHVEHVLYLFSFVTRYLKLYDRADAPLSLSKGRTPGASTGSARDDA